MRQVRTFIIVDDDHLSNLICTMALKNALGNVHIKTFLSPEEGLAYIKEAYEKDQGLTILLLDINMPTLSGWDFMEQYETFSETIKDQLIIYILSSSVDKRDKEKANASKYVSGFISKPLEAHNILALKGIK
jgi:response regulator RpfG family c-di-GMP phosphodiesterase